MMTTPAGWFGTVSRLNLNFLWMSTLHLKWVGRFHSGKTYNFKNISSIWNRVRLPVDFAIPQNQVWATAGGQVYFSIGGLDCFVFTKFPTGYSIRGFDSLTEVSMDLNRSRMNCIAGMRFGVWQYTWLQFVSSFDAISAISTNFIEFSDENVAFLLILLWQQKSLGVNTNLRIQCACIETKKLSYHRPHFGGQK